MKVGEIYIYQKDPNGIFIVTSPEDPYYYKAFWIDSTCEGLEDEFEATFPDDQDQLLTSIFIGEI